MQTPSSNSDNVTHFMPSYVRLQFRLLHKHILTFFFAKKRMMQKCDRGKYVFIVSLRIKYRATPKKLPEQHITKESQRGCKYLLFLTELLFGELFNLKVNGCNIQSMNLKIVQMQYQFVQFWYHNKTLYYAICWLLHSKDQKVKLCL